MVRRGGRILCWACIAFTLLFGIVTCTGVLQLWTTMLTSPWSETPAEVLLVLAGDSVAPHMLGLSSYWRSVSTVWEWQRGGYRRIVISGGAGIAESMRDFIVAQGIPREAIQLETTALTTRESALRTVELVRNTPGRKAILTSDYHSYRAWRAFQKAGLDGVPRPIPDAGKRIRSLSMRWPVFLELVLETSKVGWYWWHGWI